MTTVNFFAADMDAARAWYTQVFGAEPYYDREFAGVTAYLEWRLGDRLNEFGLLNSQFAPHPVGAPGGAIVYWAVDDVHAAHARLLELGASPHAEATEHGPGFVTASVVDPFGNVLGVMFNQHYLDMLAG